MIVDVMLSQLIRLRFLRGLSIDALGPNEARFVFDAALGFLSSLIAFGFCRMYDVGASVTSSPLIIIVLPAALMGANLLFGIYSRLRMARARTKIAALSSSVLVSAGTAWLVFGNRPEIPLWSVLVIVPLTLARLLVGLHSGRHPTLSRIAVARHGPVLVIGGAGYIGSHTVDVLLDGNYDVRVLYNLMYGSEPLAEFRNHPRFSMIEGDVTDISKLTAAMKDCSAVVHLAGVVGDPACSVSLEFTRHANIVATRMVKEVAEATGIHRLVFASSCSVYGTSDQKVSETHELNPVSLYAQTKIDSERELLSVVRDEFFVTILRFATVFGHSRRPRFDLVANLFTAQAMTNGLITVIGPNQWRPFIHVRDLARAIVAVLDADPRLTQSQIFNVGDERLNMTILQLGELVRGIASQHRPVDISVTESPGDRRNYAVSFEKIRSVIGYQAETLLPEGIQEMVDCFLAGSYGDFRSAEYSNVAMTTKALDTFQDPDHLSRLYAPLNAK